MGWKKYEGQELYGTPVEGDKNASPTKWWNHLWLVLNGWKTVAVFRVSQEATERGYRVGYVPFDGSAVVNSVVNYHREFRMRVGHEDCVFFAVMTDGREAPLKLMARADISDKLFAYAPLH
ncbi:hypothetical protein KKF59_03225 [Patescibacteria group bacterium]|nr:hypothetical protein [Patescibacteria group bacterium]MBU1034231.1 hypothetical protein [Patescibacteria group bacterium]MBU1630104.1 hypothetical protein [Patescibacteria group bacterium]MBU1908118.1 hypothetical protein [Patescibacteria group bacterium]